MKILGCTVKPKLQTVKMTVFVLLVIAVSAFIFTNSLATVEESKELSGGIVKVIKEIVDPENKIDTDVFHHIVRKTAHFVEFFILGALYMLIKNGIDGKIAGSLVLFPLFATLATAVTDEYIQFFSGRGSGVNDVVLDFFGAVTGIVLTGVVLFGISAVKHRMLTKNQ